MLASSSALVSLGFPQRLRALVGSSEFLAFYSPLLRFGRSIKAFWHAKGPFDTSVISEHCFDLDKGFLLKKGYPRPLVVPIFF